MLTPKSKSPKSKSPSSPMKMSSIPFKGKDDKLMRAMLRLVQVKDNSSSVYMKLDVTSAKPLSEVHIEQYTFNALKKEINALLECKDPLLSLIIETSTSRLSGTRLNILEEKYGMTRLSYNHFSSNLYKDILEKNNIIETSDIKKYLRVLLENIEMIPKYIQVRN